MAILWVQDDQANSNVSVTTLGVTWTTNTTTGNLIVVAIGSATFSGNTASRVTDSQGNIYIRAVISQNSTASYIEVWYAKNITGGVTPTVTATFPGNIRPTMAIVEFSGLDTIQPLDIALTSPVPNPITAYRIDTVSRTRATNELIFVACHANANTTWSLGSGFSNLQTQTNTTCGAGGTENAIVSTIAQQTGLMTLGSAGTGTMALITFADVTMPPFKFPSPINNYQFLKVGDGMSTGEKIR